MAMPVSLQSLSPLLYQLIVSKLGEDFHIHPYDIQIQGIKKEKGVHVIVSYGSQFSHKQEQFFTFKEMKSRDKNVYSFIDKIGKDCKEVMIDDYFKMMTP